MKSKHSNHLNFYNRKAKFDYHFLRTEIAGIELVGTEVKSLRDGKVNLSEAFCAFDKGELWLINSSITPNTNSYPHEALRRRKLLLKRKELDKLQKDLIKGLTIVPVRIFTNEYGYFKLEIALAKGKKDYDKRETIKERDIQRDLNRGE